MVKSSGVLAILVAAGVAVCGISTADDKVPDIHEIMSKGNKKNGLRDKIAIEARKSAPDWATIQTYAKDYLALAEALPKNKPPKGDMESWNKLAGEYVKIVKEMNDAAQKKNKDNVLAANQKLMQGCKTCHDLHQEH